MLRPPFFSIAASLSSSTTGKLFPPLSINCERTANASKNASRESIATAERLAGRGERTQPGATDRGMAGDDRGCSDLGRAGEIRWHPRFCGGVARGGSVGISTRAGITQQRKIFLARNAAERRAGRRLDLAGLPRAGARSKRPIEEYQKGRLSADNQANHTRTLKGILC